MSDLEDCDRIEGARCGLPRRGGYWLKSHCKLKMVRRMCPAMCKICHGKKWVTCRVQASKWFMQSKHSKYGCHHLDSIWIKEVETNNGEKMYTTPKLNPFVGICEISNSCYWCYSYKMSQLPEWSCGYRYRESQWEEWIVCVLCCRMGRRWGLCHVYHTWCATALLQCLKLIIWITCLCTNTSLKGNVFRQMLT
mgnify:CR=1 FL=1